jgi:DNA-3-methyladenine glycosylase
MHERASKPGTRKPEPRWVPLPRSLYEPRADVVAPRLLGHWLIRRMPGGTCGGLIVETEAYLDDDPACHAFKGETPRNRAMFGPPGHAYVYFIYGNHFCVNAVCRPRGCGEAVLIRAIEPVFGEDVMRHRRPVRAVHDLSNGPGKLCAALDITRDLDGAELCEATSPLLIARNPRRNGCVRKLGPLACTSRIGITQAAGLPLRFCLAGSPWISRKLPRSPRQPRSDQT